MATVNIREFKAHLSEFVERAQTGETIVVAKRNVPVAELRPVRRRSNADIFGKPVKGLSVPSTFFEALPKQLLSAFSGEDVE